MKQALELIRKLIETHRATHESSDFEQGICEGLIMARRELQNHILQQPDSANGHNVTVITPSELFEKGESTGGGM